MHVMHLRNMRNKNKIICNKNDTDLHKIFLIALHGLFFTLLNYGSDFFPSITEE